jgi:hypothetical protein
MKKMLFVSLLALTGCFGKPIQNNLVILLDASSLTSMGSTYTVWYGLTEYGQPATGIIPKKKDLRVGDIIVVKKYTTDNTWAYVKRINANR